MKPSLSIAYNMARKAKKMAKGGETGDPGYDKAKGIKAPSEQASGYEPVAPEEDWKDQKMKMAEGGEAHMCSGADCAHACHGKMMAEGGQITDNYQTDYKYREKPDMKNYEKETGWVTHQGNDVKPNGKAMAEDDRDLNQHGWEEQGPYGMAMAEGGQITDNYQDPDQWLDMVGRIMAKRQNHYSEGGKVANGGMDKLKNIADGKPNNFDDLSLRDDLESTYGKDDNAGDALGNKREDEDRQDIISRIMRSRSKRDRMPSPA
jgi:hypothetical protein